jgi:glutamyl-tRNA synthetase
VILDGLTWLGMDWDDEPVFQGARLARHQEMADRLLTEGNAYLDEGAIRLRIPPGEIAWDDAVHGRIAFQGADIKDFVILRSDRTPLYNFAVVADDVDMRITHVIRGDDHVSNTPKQLAVYRALGHTPPVFGHVPMIHGPDGKKLSKRHGATAVGDYRPMGILPAAMRNFLALLGWSPEELYDLVAPQLAELGVTAERDAVLRAITAARARSRTTVALARQVAVRLDGRLVELDDKARKEIVKDPAAYRDALDAAVAVLRDAEWEPAALEQTLRALAERRGVAAGKIFQPIRIALTGGTVSEPVNELLYAVGKEAALRRLAAHG